jgi:hypothetical protein
MELMTLMTLLYVVILSDGHQRSFSDFIFCLSTDLVSFWKCPNSWYPSRQSLKTEACECTTTVHSNGQKENLMFRNQSSKYSLVGPLPFPLCSPRTSTDWFKIVEIGRKELPLMYDGLVPSDHPSHP